MRSDDAGPDAETLLRSAPLVLTEGAIYERLRRRAALRFDPSLAHAALLYEAPAARVLAAMHGEYLAVARRHALPAVLQTDTWRASRGRVAASAWAGRPVNEDNVRFLRDVIRAAGEPRAPVLLAGLLGPRGDAYRAEEALSRRAAADYHAWQAEELAAGGVDLLVAATLPALSEAAGLADAMARTGLPYLVSFVVRPAGTLLDGTPLGAAIDAIDTSVGDPPVGYAVNCVHPSVLAAALGAQHGAVARLVGFQANTSARSLEELDGAAALEGESPARFGAGMRDVRDRFGLRLLGGCCGTDGRHLAAVAECCGANPAERGARSRGPGGKAD